MQHFKCSTYCHSETVEEKLFLREFNLRRMTNVAAIVNLHTKLFSECANMPCIAEEIAYRIQVAIIDKNSKIGNLQRRFVYLSSQQYLPNEKFTCNAAYSSDMHRYIDTTHANSLWVAMSRARDHEGNGLTEVGEEIKVLEAWKARKLPTEASY